MADIAEIQAHIGRSETSRDWADPTRLARLAALLDGDWSTRDMLPPLAHFLFFPPAQRQSLMGKDGHPVRNADTMLPHAGLPRRMWAGSRMNFHGDIRPGDSLTRQSKLVSAAPKIGQSGNMLFCTIRHDIFVAEGNEPIICEEQDIVFREAHSGDATAPRPAIDVEGQPDAGKVLRADTIMLFRYSALTFNAHRIHYDWKYAREVEGYDGLVVHGPLLATLMLDRLRELAPDRTVSEFSFRARSAIFEGEEIGIGVAIGESGARLCIRGPVGLAMTGTASFA